MYCCSFLQLSSRRSMTCCMNASRSVWAETTGLAGPPAAVNPRANPTDAARRMVLLDSKFLGAPLQAQLARRRHVAHERRRDHDCRAREIAFTAEAHPVLPVAVERRDRALAFRESVRTLAEAWTAP